MRLIIKKILALWLIIYFAICVPTAYAASAGGWAFSSFNVATSVVSAMKNGASASVAVAKSPITSKIAKGIVGGVIAGAALPLAISQITGIALSALDWVLDPANNAVKYKTTAPTDLNEFCRLKFIQFYGVDSSGYYNGTRPDGKISCADSRGVVLSGFTVPNSDYKSIPISTVADKIYDNAKTDSNSRSVVNDAVKEYVNEGSADVALDNAKTDADATHNCGTGTHWSGFACVADTPSTPDTPFDPSSIIDAINSVFDAVMSLPDVINNALDSLLVDIKDFFHPVIDLVTDFFQWFKDTALEWKNDFVEEYRSFRDWIKSDPDPQTDSKPDVYTTAPTKSATDFDTDYLRFGGQCPSFSPTTISVGIVAVPISFNAQPLCDFAILCRPIILALAYFAAMAIVANAIRSE